MGVLDYFRMRNVFGDKPNFGNAAFGPNPQQQQQSPVMKADPTQASPLPSRNTVPYGDVGQESIDVYPEEGTALGALKRNVMNPPRVPFEYPKNTNAGLDAALKVLATPTDYDKNRVYVDGRAYQKQQVITDAEGKKHYVTNVKEPSFMDQVLKAMPAAASPAVDILNAQSEMPLKQWEMENKALTGAANIEKTEETNRALAAQRYATAANIPAREQRLGAQGDEKLRQSQQRIDQNQQKLDHLMSRQDLTDSEKAALADKYKKENIQLQGEINKQMQEMRGGQRLEQIGAKGEVDKDLQELRGTQRSDQIAQTGEEQRKTVGARGEEARETKQTPSANAGATSQLPTQERVRRQNMAGKAKTEHPEWSKWISIGQDGQVEITPPTSGYFSRGPDQKTYDEMVQYMNGGETKKETAPPPTKPAPAPKPPPAKKSDVEEGYVAIADETGKIVAQVKKDDPNLKKLNKKYHVVKS